LSFSTESDQDPQNLLALHTYYHLSHRIKARRGAKKAMMAVGHALLVICYHVLDRRVAYQELGANYFDERERQTVEKRLVHRLQKLGYEVSLQPKCFQVTHAEI
jgi:hypothetical protein